MTDRDTTTRTRARAPGVGGVFHRMAVHDRVLRPDSERTTVATTKCTKGGCKLDRRTADAGSRLKPPITQEGHRLDSQPSSRTGENSPYGMIGGIEETSASFEARSAPRSYPTRLCENARERRTLRMIFSIAVCRWRVRTIFTLGLTGLRLCFYTKIEPRSFHTVWTLERASTGAFQYPCLTSMIPSRTLGQYFGAV